MPNVVEAALEVGTVESVATFEDARKKAEEIGHPIIKGSAGSGGRGITVVHDPELLEHEYRSTRNSARARRRADRLRRALLGLVSRGALVVLAEPEC
ncbi:MAG TPA: hypothetical protein VK816_08035 [Jatrophihabitantaceae bacterium]|nr:hypothetical protein [Jatrophihabitantaceae bacterium]